eukprot:358035-Chlamydomonas_euryale.AAC.2
MQTMLRGCKQGRGTRGRAGAAGRVAWPPSSRQSAHTTARPGCVGVRRRPPRPRGSGAEAEARLTTPASACAARRAR